MKQKDIDKLSDLIDKIGACVIVSSQYGIELFKRWEEKNKDKYGVFKKIELSDDKFLNSDKIYLLPTPIENKSVRVYFEGE